MRTYPIHSSAGGRVGGLIHKADWRRCISSCGVYRTAILRSQAGALGSVRSVGSGLREKKGGEGREESCVVGWRRVCVYAAAS